MSHNHTHRMTRRDFLKLTGAALGGFSMACATGSSLIELTAVPTAAGAAAIPTVELPSGAAADTILYNGNIVTMDANRSTVKALAIKDGLILAVGDDDSIRKLAGGKSQLVNLKGKTATPGLIDAHCHLSMCGLLGTVYVDLNWPAVFTIKDVQDRLAARAAVTPPGEWVIGSGWVTFEGRYPTKHDIDPVSSKHPIMAINQGGHMAVVNSLALEMAGITAKTPDPGNGLLLREANGEPNGTIMNHPAMDIFRRLWPSDLFNLAAMEASVLFPQTRFASMGVTSFQDVYARDMDRMQAYFNIAKRGEMTIRGQVMNVLEYIQELEGRIDAIEAMRYESGFMHFAGGKFQLDGAVELSYTLEPHNGISWNKPIWKAKDLNEAVKAFHDAGYQVSLHTIGDAATDMALDAIEKAMNANPRPDPRHRIEHSILNSDKALKRTRDLGVVISTQPQAIRMFADGMEAIWGKERVQRMVPTRSWLDLGVPLSLSSDAPSMPWWDPQTTIFASMVRLSNSRKPVSPEQALTIEEAMYAHTMGGAYANFEEQKKGSLEAGKMADVIVWSDNPYSVKPQDILKLTMDQTIVGGKVVYQA